MSDTGFEVRTQDIAHARRRLDDMQAQGLDLITIDFWRQVLDGYETTTDKLDAAEKAFETLESAIDDVSFDLDPIENIGSLGDVTISPSDRKTVQDEVDSKDAARVQQAAALVASAEAYLRHGLAELRAALDGDEKPKPPSNLVKPKTLQELQRAGVATAPKPTKKKAKP